MKQKPDLDYIFHPESYAIIGASDQSTNFGNIMINELLTGGFKGKIYPVNPTFKEILGIRCYADIREIEGPVDHVLVGIKAEYTPDLMKACAEKNVKVCHFFTSGFSEIGTDEGIRLESEIIDIARKNGIRIIGPNSMGIYCPSSGMYLSGGLSRESGSFGMLSQSGGNIIYLSRLAALRGAPISKTVSYGNALDINESELLEYFAGDDETSVIGGYIEGVKDASLFQAALKKAASSKPTIIYKAGKTEMGASAAVSHTGALAGSIQVWDSVIKKAGALNADSLEELVDLALLFLYMKPPKGRRVGLVGVGGGISVMAADSMHRSNLELPEISEEAKERLKKYIPNAGNIYKNPVDTNAFFADINTFKNTMKIFSEWKDIDMLVFHLAYDVVGWPLKLLSGSGITHEIARRLADYCRDLKVPVAVILHYHPRLSTYQLYIEDQEICWKAGLPVFTSIDSTAKALNKFISHHERKEKLAKHCH